MTSGDDKNVGQPLTGHYMTFEWGSWSQRVLGEPVNWHHHGKTSVKTSADELPRERAEGAYQLVQDFLAGQNVDPGLRPHGIRLLIERQITRNEARGDIRENVELRAMLARPSATVTPAFSDPRFLRELREVYALLLAKAAKGELTPCERTVRERIHKIIEASGVASDGGADG